MQARFHCGEIRDQIEGDLHPALADAGGVIGRRRWWHAAKESGAGALAPLLRGSAETVYNAPGTLTSAFDGRNKLSFDWA